MTACGATRQCGGRPYSRYSAVPTCVSGPRGKTPDGDPTPLAASRLVCPEPREDCFSKYCDEAWACITYEELNKRTERKPDNGRRQDRSSHSRWFGRTRAAPLPLF